MPGWSEQERDHDHDQEHCHRDYQGLKRIDESIPPAGQASSASGEWSPESQSCGDHDYFEDHPSSGFGVELEVEHGGHENLHLPHATNTKRRPSPLSHNNL